MQLGGEPASRRMNGHPLALPERQWFRFRRKFGAIVARQTESWLQNEKRREISYENKFTYVSTRINLDREQV